MKNEEAERVRKREMKMIQIERREAERRKRQNEVLESRKVQKLREHEVQNQGKVGSQNS